MQRLFSMFPNGWPGKGLLILRLAAGGFFVKDGVGALTGPPHVVATTSLLVAAAAGILLLVGLWTPVAGIFAATAEVILALSGVDHPRATILLVVLGISLAMLGPGTWSVDALLFGRQRLDLH